MMVDTYYFNLMTGGLSQIGPTSRVTGRMDGMNEYGLVMAYNFMHRKKACKWICMLHGWSANT